MHKQAPINKGECQIYVTCFTAAPGVPIHFLSTPGLRIKQSNGTIQFLLLQPAEGSITFKPVTIEL